jgi:nitrite reductase/ring-hydroxylating ferredoxin subunit
MLQLVVEYAAKAASGLDKVSTAVDESFKAMPRARRQLHAFKAACAHKGANSVVLRSGNASPPFRALLLAEAILHDYRKIQSGLN